MTWDNLIARTLVPFEGRIGQIDTRAGLYLDEAQEDFALFTRCFVKKINVYYYKEKSHITLPDDFVELADEPIFRSHCLKKASSNSLDYTKSLDTNIARIGTPYEYFIEDNRMYLIPRPQKSGVLTITYVGVPKSLRSLSGLKRFRFDTVASEYFRVGDVLKSRIGASNSTTTTATVERIEYLDALEGHIVISNITNGFTNNNEDFYASGGEADQYANDYGTDWSQFVQGWNVLGIGGLARTKGVQFDYTDTKPQIPDVYHYHLVDYAKAMIHQDLGDIKQYQNHYSLYVANREKARSTVANKDTGNMGYVSDRLAVGIL